MTIDDWMNQPHHYCKPIAKTTQDRAALLHVIQQGNPKFFLGTDSAPHPKYKKETDQVSAGVYILPQHTLPLLASLLLPNLNNFENFVAIFGRQFYQLPLPQRRHVILSSTHHQHLSRLLPEPFIKIPPFVSFVIENNEKVEVVPFRKGESLTWVVSEQHL
ncbi:hypothetical protein HMI54_008078 [Coelomomyces lativittatus]|nr:hypothetical protein HMI54_008078 [Coelomomyces lativittatus]KAJ1514643.1 hypothetical protein HMI55_004486 [Coelomomyces lativittatus]